MINVHIKDGRTIHVDTTDANVAKMKVARFLAQENVARDTPAGRIVGGAGSTLLKSVPFADEVGAVGPTVADMLRGNSVGDSWRQARANQDAYADDFAKSHPVAAPLTTGTGYGGQIAAAIASGGASAEPEIAAAGRGLLGKLADFAVKVAPKRAAVGGLLGALNGFASEGTAAERLQKANAAVVPSAAASVVVPSIVSGMAKAAPVVARTLGMTGAPARVAAQKLGALLREDGATPDVVRNALNGYLKNGATDPNLVDIASRLPGGGQKTLAFVKDAVSTGPAAKVARTYADQTAADLQDKATERTQSLSPTARPAVQIAKTAAEAHKALADEQYGAVREDPIDAQPVLDQLRGTAGKAAFNVVLKRLDAAKDWDGVSDLTNLRDVVHPKPAPITGEELTAPAPDPNAPVQTTVGLLHQLKDAFGEMGEKEGDAQTAKYHFETQKALSDYLADNNTGYSAARDAFRQRVAAIDALAHGRTGVSAKPEEFAAGLAELKAKAAMPAGVPSLVDPMAQAGHANALTDAIGAPKEDAVSVLDKLSTATNQGKNLATTFGPDAAERYQGGLADLADQARTAKLVRPKLGDAVQDEPAPASVQHLSIRSFINGALKKLAEGQELTDDEREAVAHLAFTQAAGNAALEPGHFATAQGASIPSLPVLAGAIASDVHDQRPSQ